MKLGIREKTYLLIGLFISSVVTANLIASKIATLFGIDFSVAILVFPITFLATDILSEVHGKKFTQKIVWVAFASLFFIMVIVMISVILPTAERSFVDSEYTKVFGMSLRIFIASMIAFIVGQTHDVWAFHFWKKKTKGKHLWLRNNLSTIVSQFIDTMIFMYLAFYMMTPKFTVIYVFSLVIPYYLVKVFAAIIDTPLVYLGVKWMKKSKQDL